MERGSRPAGSRLKFFIWVACAAWVRSLKETLWVVVFLSVSGRRYMTYIPCIWYTFLDGEYSLNPYKNPKILTNKIMIPGHYESIRFYTCGLRWLLSGAVSAWYMCAFAQFSLSSPSVSQPAGFKMGWVGGCVWGVCVWGVCVLTILVQSSIQNIQNWSLPLPLAVFGLGSCHFAYLCISVRGILIFFKNGSKASLSATRGRCLCSFPRRPPGIPVARQGCFSSPARRQWL